MIYPEGYNSKLTQRETQYAIKTVKDTFQLKLSKALNLDRVTAPIMVTKGSGINDDLNGVERKVHFTMKNIEGEAQCSVWSDKMREECATHNIILL